jgi:hypothetical protein
MDNLKTSHRSSGIDIYFKKGTVIYYNYSVFFYVLDTTKDLNFFDT